jgi:micrococcal nuclease
MYEYRVKEIVSIYDGDTMKVVVDLGFGIYTKQTLRLYGINAPEMRGSDKVNGKITRDWLRGRVYEAVENKTPISIRTKKDKTGKYGRLLAEVFISDEKLSLNEQMVENGLAIEYMKG